MLFPPGFVGVDYANVPGWSTRVIETKLATPITEDGETIDTEVSQIVWTWTGQSRRSKTASSSTSRLSLAIPDDAAGKPLEFRTVQTYSNGAVVHWIDPSLKAEHPAPRINVTAKGGVVQEVAGDEAGPEAGATGSSPATTATTSTIPSGGSLEGLGVAALIVGILGLVFGILALLAVRSSKVAT